MTTLKQLRASTVPMNGWTSPPRRRHPTGFTIIELVVVIVIIGVLAATALPRFVDLTGDARRAALAATGGAFASGANLVHVKWIAAGAAGAVLDFIPISAASGSGALSVNANGWPADMRGTSLTLNSNFDCVDVWNAVLSTGAATVSEIPGSADYHAIYAASACTFELQADPSLNITYNSTTGTVAINN